MEHSVAARVRAYVRSAPATYVYLFTLTVTTWVLETSSGPLARRLLYEQSTNLARLEREPLQVLVSSAFWLSESSYLVFWAIAFTLVLAPAERWIGTGRFVATFAIGHVGATLLTAAALALALRLDVAEHTVRTAQDVGASYGFFAVAGLLTFALRGRARLLYAAAVWVAVVVGFLLVDEPAAGIGHAVAVPIGYLCWLVYGRPVRGNRGSWPSATSAATPARGRPSSPS